MTILDPIPFHVDEERLSKALRLDDMPEFAEAAMCLAHEAEGIARPKGMLRLCAVEPISDESVAMDGVPFHSRVLRVNLEGSHRAFPFVATCGLELEEWSRAIEDPLAQFWADVIKEAALRDAIEALGDHLVETYRPGVRGAMNPGSLSDWPISEQPLLFSLFSGETDRIGVRLTESYLMYPVKSVSGVWFETEKGFQNCELCPREGCPNRRAAHDPGLYDRKYRTQER